MGVLSAAILILSVVFLAYQYPNMFQNVVSAWFGGASHGQPPLEPRSLTETEAVDKGVHDSGPTAGDSTPKATATPSIIEVPSFELSDTETQQSPDKDPGQLSNSSGPASNSLLRGNATAPPRPQMKQSTSASASSLMPPPARPSVRPNTTTALRIPSTGPLPNRGPPANSQQRVQSGLSPNGAVATPNSRGKVLLSPGHSPMDWAALTRKGNLTGVDTFRRVTPSQLRQMTGRKGKPAWSSWQGKVYNITPYLPFHPGGEAELMKAAGRDGTKLFMDVHPWVNWENMLSACLVGVLVSEEIVSPLESID